jgi:hypothetical protein
LTGTAILFLPGRSQAQIVALGVGLWLTFRGTTNAHCSAHNVAMTIRRVKTYTGAQGYVYQYYFVGNRAALPDDAEAPATEFVFDVTSDRKLTYAVSVFLPDSARAAWSKAHGRPLNDAEQYAGAKLRLFRAFDELEDMKTNGRRLSIDAAVLEEALASLGVD